MRGAPSALVAGVCSGPLGCPLGWLITCDGLLVTGVGLNGVWPDWVRDLGALSPSPDEAPDTAADAFPDILPDAFRLQINQQRFKI